MIIIHKIFNAFKFYIKLKNIFKLLEFQNFIIESSFLTQNINYYIS